jgi:hypothetical protein
MPIRKKDLNNTLIKSGCYLFKGVFASIALTLIAHQLVKKFGY